ncbi:metallophosphoesterase family protein [Caminibacter sp.]
MKILHTSDLHIGHQFFGIDRSNEFDEFFEWLRNLIKEKEVDVLIIAGDVFDVYNPSTTALRQYFDFLKSIKEMVKKVIVIGGNHDSPNTLKAPKSLLEEIDVEVISGAEDDYVKLIEFEDFDILAVSYLREGILSKIDENFEEAFKKIYRPSGKPTIATGHFTVYGSRASGSERDIYIGKIEGIGSHIFDGFSYVSLGHIHRPQEIEKGVVYSGSPLRLSFDEKYQKKVVLIDTQNFSYEFIDVPVFREFVRLKGSFEEVKEKIEKIKKESFVEIELDEVVDSVRLDEIRRDDLHIVKISLPFAEITSESIDVDKITPKGLIESIFKDDEDLEEILKIVDELRVEDEA